MSEKVICKICGKESSRIYGAHLKFHGLTSEQYLELYPNAPLYTETDLKQTSKNSGKHMKEEKYKKMFAERVMGDKNPNSKSKTTEEQRKQRSPFSKEFIKYNNENQAKEFSKKVNEGMTPEKRTSRIEYYLSKGFSQEEAEKMLKERQTTFSLEKCIEKYGKQKGKEKYSQRQIVWQKTLNENGNLKHGFSKASQELFYKILENYQFKYHKYIFFATKNKEFNLLKDSGGIWIYDYTDTLNKKIIEYNGDEYHANPKRFKANEISHPFRKQYTAEQIWKKDELKKEKAIAEGFDVYIVWDSDYRSNPEKVLKECLNFLQLD